MPGRRLQTDDDIRRLLTEVKTIAVVGLSTDTTRPSHRVAASMQGAGYRIVPVHPRGEGVLGESTFTTLAEAVRETTPDLVNVFRRPDGLPELVEEAAACGVRRLWFQLGVTHPGAEAAALEAGIDLVVNRCIAVEYGRLMVD